MEAGMNKAMNLAEDPHSMPQVRRELVMLRGAIGSLAGRANDLIGKLSDFQRQEPSSDAKLAEIPTEMPVTSPFAMELRELCQECSSIEDQLSRAVYQLEI